MLRHRLRNFAVLLIGLVALGLAGAFVWLRAVSPSDNTLLEPGRPVWRSDGLVVTPLRHAPGGLQPGDVVIGANGESIEAWVRGLFRPGYPYPRWRMGDTITYTVLRNGQRLDLPVSLRRYPLGTAVGRTWGILVFVFTYLFIAGFVFWRARPDPAVRLLLLIAACAATGIPWSLSLQVSDLASPGTFWLFQASIRITYFLLWAAILHFALVFPRRQPLLVTYPWVVVLVYLVPYLLYAVYLLLTWVRAPSTLAWMAGWDVGQNSLVLLYIAMLLVASVLGYRRLSGDAVARRQSRSIFYALVNTAVFASLFGSLPELIWGRAIISWSVLALIGLLVPLALAIAILRFRLWDIDVIINRTIVYTVLTGILVLVYFSSIVVLQGVLRALTGQSSQAAIVGSTLVVAGLFAPLRRRVQAAIDRHFYRSKYNAEQTLATFSLAARQETDLDRLTDKLVEVVEETVQPSDTAVWLRQGPHVPIPGHQTGQNVSRSP